MIVSHECEKRSRRGSEGQNEYYREKELCNVMFVRHSGDLEMTEITCTGLVRNKRKGLLTKELISD
jgi:hypothetical protein